jgi:PKD repeat protein
VQVVAVANVAPTVTAAANQSAPEGTSKSIDLGSFADPGSDSPWAVDVDWGDGSTHTTFSATATGGLGSQAHTYADGPAAQTVTVKVTDKDGVSNSKTFTVNVTNVGPKVTLSAANDLSVDEGTTHTYSYSISDPGQDTVQSVQVGCGGRGSVVTGSTTNDNTSGSFTCSFPDGLSPATASTVSVSATDSDGGTGAQDMQSVTVKNVAPTVTPAADQTATEGSSQSFTLGSFGDPGTDSPWKAAVSWGDSSATQNLADQTATGSLGSASHTYADNGTYTVSVTVTDKDGGKDTKTFQVAVANVKPTITSFTGTDYLAGANAFVGGGGIASTLTTKFTDPGADTWTGFFTYQDGSPLTETKSPFVTGQQVKHTFASPGCKSASVKVTDDDGGYDTASTTISVGTGAFQAPMTNQPVTDKLKNGQVLPVKVHVNDCSGAAATTLAPAIRLVKGDLTPQSDDSTTTITPASSSAADTTGVMRSSGGGDYIYNMQVNLATLNTDYTVVVYPYGTGSTVELGHVIQATK